jgi:hypothetical protein
MGKYLDERENDEVFEAARRSAPSGLSPGMRDTGRLRSSFVNSSSSEHRGMGFNGEGKGKGNVQGNSEGKGEGEDKGECEGKHSNGSEGSSSSHNGRRNVSCSRNDNSSNSDITNDSSSNSNDKIRSNNRAENTIEIECENESKEDSSGMDISPPTESSSSSSISNNNSRNITINTVETNKNHNFNHNKKDKDKDKEKKNKSAMKNKKRSAKVVWSNKNIENLNFLFTLDSHVPSEALNYFNGFLPLVTASANVVVTTTDMSNSDIESIKSNKKNITDIISNIVTAANAKKEVNIIDQSCNKAAAAGGGGGGGGSDFNTRNLKNSRIVIDSPPSSSKSYSYFNHTPNDAYTKNNGKDWESVNNLDSCVDSDHSSFSVLKVACDIGNNHREGAFVSHHIVRKECSPSLEEPSSSPDRILQIQAKACAGLESKFSKRDDTPGKGVNLRGSDDRNFDPGYFERKNKERRAKRTSYPSILKEKNESEERGDSFSGDFLFEYYESRAADSSSSRCAGMKISINDGPALTLMDKCLDVAASNSKMYSCGKELRKVPQGPARRREVDDITILVVTFR